MGEVYRARDSRLHRDVAIKVLPEAGFPGSRRARAFRARGRAVAALSHSNILGIFDIGREDGVAYAVTELLEGRTLRDEIDEARIPVRRWRRLRDPDRTRARGGARARDRAPGSQARERVRHAGRAGQDPRFRPRHSRPEVSSGESENADGLAADRARER